MTMFMPQGTKGALPLIASTMSCDVKILFVDKCEEDEKHQARSE
jgi:hypothetical protein